MSKPRQRLRYEELEQLVREITGVPNAQLIIEHHRDSDMTHIDVTVCFSASEAVSMLERGMSPDALRTKVMQAAGNVRAYLREQFGEH